MSRKVSNKKNNKKSKKDKYNNDIKGVVFITLAILVALSVFATNSSGIVGQTIKKIFFLCFGIGAYLLPVILALIGTSYIVKGGKLKFSRRFYGANIVIINTILFIQMINIDKYYEKGMILESLKNISVAEDTLNGGIIGFLIDLPLYGLFGKAGSYIIFLAIYVIAFILIYQISLKDFLLKLKPVKVVKIKKIKQGSFVEDSYDEEKNIDEEKQGFIKNINDKFKVIDFMKSTEGYGEEEPKIIDNIKENRTLQEEVSVEKINEELNDRLIKKTTIEKIEYTYPSEELLSYGLMDNNNKSNKKELIGIASKLEETLSSFGVDAKVIQVTRGPSVTRFELQPSPGVKVSKITHLADDIALSLAATSIRIEAPIPGKSAVGIEVPNSNVSPVYLREILEDSTFKEFNENLAFALGKGIGGNCVVTDLSKMPHLLIAGATGSGKSVCINTLIVSLLYKYSPEDVKLLLVDPKVVELIVYNDIPHLLIPVVTNPKKAAGALNWAVNEMTRRYNLFAENNVRNIEGYNELFFKGKIDDKLPWIVIIIDELADLMMVSPGEVEEYIARLAQMARAAGMHLVIATQRPSVDVITGVIKANIPSRISFAVSSQIDSRTILDSSGAEKLLGRGDMLFYPLGESKPTRIQGAFISEEEVEKVVEFIKSHRSDVEYEEKIIEEINNNFEKGNSDCDELFEEAVKQVVECGQASASFLQRKLRIGYNRAARIIEQMEEKGIISGRNGSKPRQILKDKDIEEKVE